MFFVFGDQYRGELAITLKKTVQLGSFIHLLSSVETNYIRLVTLGSLVSLIRRGASDDQFFIARRSSEIFDTEEDRAEFFSSKKARSSIRSGDEYTILGSKSDSAHEFWRLLGKRKRPVVLFRDGQNISPLYTFDGNESLKLLNARLMSPSDSTLGGLIGPIIDLIDYPARYRRDEEKHRKDMDIKSQVEIQEQYRSIGEFCRVSKILDDAPKNSGYYQYAKNLMKDVSENMESTIKRSGASVRITRINEKV